MNGWVQGDPAEDLTPSLVHGAGSRCLCIDGTRPLGCFMYWRQNQVSWLAVAELVMLRMMDDGFLGWKRTNGLVGVVVRTTGRDRKGTDG